MMHVEQANRHSQNEPSDPPTVNLLPKIDSRDLGPHLRTVCGKGPPALECVRHTPCSASRDCSVGVGARCWPLGWRGRFLFSLSVCKFSLQAPQRRCAASPLCPEQVPTHAAMPCAVWATTGFWGASPSATEPVLCADTQGAFSLSFTPHPNAGGPFPPLPIRKNTSAVLGNKADRNGVRTRGAEQGHPWGKVSKISGAVARVWENYGPPD